MVFLLLVFSFKKKTMGETFLPCFYWIGSCKNILEKSLLATYCSRNGQHCKIFRPFCHFPIMLNENNLHLLLEMQCWFMAKGNFLEQKYMFQNIVNNRFLPWDSLQHP